MIKLTKSLFRLTVTLAASLTLVGAANAQQSSASGKTIAIVSIIGDTVSVVSQQKQTGRLVNANRKQTVDLPEQGIDSDIMSVADNVVKKLCSNCKTALLKVKAVETPEEGEKMLPGLLGAAKNAKADRLIVLTKHREDARIDYNGQTKGSGKLTGLGFYLDGSSEMKDEKTLAITNGFLGPFTYFKLHVIDVNTGDVLYSQGLTSGKAYTVNEKETFGVWNAIPDDKKIPVLLEMIKAQLDRELASRFLS